MYKSKQCKKQSVNVQCGSIHYLTFKQKRFHLTLSCSAPLIYVRLFYSEDHIQKRESIWGVMEKNDFKDVYKNSKVTTVFLLILNYKIFLVQKGENSAGTYIFRISWWPWITI